MIVHGRNSLPARLCVLLVAAEPGDGIDGIRNTAATAKQMKGSAERHDPKTHPEGAAAERHEGTRKAPSHGFAHDESERLVLAQSPARPTCLGKIGRAHV